MSKKLEIFVNGHDIENDVYLLKIMGELYEIAFETNSNRTNYYDISKNYIMLAHELSHKLDILNPIRLSLMWNFPHLKYDAIDLKNNLNEKENSINIGFTDIKSKTQTLFEKIGKSVKNNSNYDKANN